MASIPEAVAQIQAAGVPVLFLDTCVLLDLIRAPKRGLRGWVEAGVRLLGSLGPTPRSLLVAASFLPGESRDHSQATGDELTKHLAGLDNQAGLVRDACSAVGVACPGWPAPFAATGLPAALLTLSQRLLTAAVHLDGSDECRLRAFARAATKVPPSRRGGEIKDATILEEYLAVARGLRAAGYPERLLLCSSNTSDYCESGSLLHPTLAAEFGAIPLGFATTLPGAVHALLP